MDLPLIFGRILRRMRKEADLTQEQLGFEAELERNYISLLERGKRQPTLTTLIGIARPLNCTAADLVAFVEAEVARRESGVTPSSM